MFKRLFWLTLGFSSGLGTSWYVVRSVKKTVRRTVATYAPAELATRAGDGVRDVRASFKVAIAEGRAAMREREAELKARIEANRLGAVVATPTPAVDGDASPGLPAAHPASGPGVEHATLTADDAAVLDELAARRNRLVARAAGHARSGQ